MDDKQISKLSLIIICTGLIFFLVFYSDPFKETTISELISEEEKTGLIFGRVETVISNTNNTLFILTNDESIPVFYPNTISIKKNDFVYVYGKTQTYKGELEIYAYKVRKDD